MAELKKCPFCGGEAELNYYGSETIPFYSVSCKECGCNQETSIHKEAVITAWNNRPTEAEIRAKAISDFLQFVYDNASEYSCEDGWAMSDLMDLEFKYLEQLKERE